MIIANYSKLITDDELMLYLLKALDNNKSFVI